jgi:hypothetical protein
LMARLRYFPPSPSRRDMYHIPSQTAPTPEAVSFASGVGAS